MTYQVPVRLIPVVLLAAFFAVSSAKSCAPAYAPGAKVSIAEETALIIWDEKSKTEHFIRRGTFNVDGKASKDFGFLVPTPTQPTLNEVAGDSIFDKLKEWTAPRIVENHIPTPRGRGTRSPAFAATKMAMSAPAGVEVLGTQRVAGLDAVKLKATNAAELKVWLTNHGYFYRPELSDWLDHYVKEGWFITAFKIAPTEPSRRQVSTTALCMSFKTEKPFYPYREPADMRTPGYHPARLLRVYVLANERMAGTLGKGPWFGRPTWAKQLDGATVKDALPKTIGFKPDEEWSPWLTMFEDTSSPRQGVDEVYFKRSDDQTTIERIEYVDVFDTEESFMTKEPIRRRILIGTTVVSGMLLLGLAGIALYFFLASRRPR